MEFKRPGLFKNPITLMGQSPWKEKNLIKKVRGPKGLRKGLKVGWRLNPRGPKILEKKGPKKGWGGEKSFLEEAN